MNTKNYRHAFRCLFTLAAVTTTLANVGRSSAVLADEQPSLEEVTAASRQQAAEESAAKLRQVLSKQRGDQLTVYLKDARQIYVNGSSVSPAELATLVRQSGLEKAVITAELEVVPARIDEVKQLIQKSGIAKVEAPQPLALGEIAAASRQRAAQARQQKLRKVLARQKGDQLGIHLRESLGISVNGTSVSLSELLTIIGESGLDNAVITADLEVLPERVAEVEELIKENGVENVDVRTEMLTLREVASASREQAARQHEKNLREILSRQRGDVLHVYLRNDIALFVNGRQISAKTLATVAGELGLKTAAITAEARVSQDRLDAISEVLKQNEVTEITVTTRE